MDQESDSGHDQQHDERQLVEIEVEVNHEGAGTDPVAQELRVRQLERREAGRDVQRHHEGRAAEAQRNRRHGLPRKAPAHKTVNGRADERQYRNQPQMKRGRHNFNRFTWSIFRVSRVRNTAMIIANPTVASAAATTITKNTNTCPLRCCHWAAKATNDRFTPLSINSIDMKMVMMLRLIRNPATPQANRMPLKIR